jgi:hypothetical protein
MSSIALKRPSAASVSPKAPLTTKTCSAIANRLDPYLDISPAKSKLLVQRLKQGLASKGKRHLEPEQATSILAKAIREIGGSIQGTMDESQATVDNAEIEKESRTQALATAETLLVDSQQAVRDCKGKLKASLQDIDAKKEGISAAKSARVTHESEAKKIVNRKRQLELIEQESYAPLKDTPAEGVDGRKRLATLRRAGKAFGFHSELLTIAPVVLRKQLDARRTFDEMIVQQLEKEFNKNTIALDANIKESECGAQERIQAMESAEEELLAAKAAHKKAREELAAAETSLVESREALTEAKRRLRVFPAEMKRNARALLIALNRLEKFHRGPLSSFHRAVGHMAIVAPASPTEATEEDEDDERENSESD